MVFGFGRRKSVSKADAKKSVEKSESLPDRIPTPPPEEPFKKKEGPGKNDLAKFNALPITNPATPCPSVNIRYPSPISIT